MAPKVLVVLTSKNAMIPDEPALLNKISEEQKKSPKPTGWYLPELAHPYYELVGYKQEGESVTAQSPAKAEIVMVSPKGGMAPVDQSSVDNFTDAQSTSFYKLKNEEKGEVGQSWTNTDVLSKYVGRASEFDAIFYPGGHGPMFDLITDADSIKLIEEFWKAGKAVASVCHGPIVLTRAQVDGKPLLEGREATGFTNSEENAANMTSFMPVLLEDEIKRVGGKFVKGEDWQPKVVVDGQLITGQNPASASSVGKAIAKAIGL